MQKLAETSLRRPIFASMIILALVVVGVAAYVRLGVDRLPSVDLPTVSVRTSWPGAAVEDVETEISERIEEVVNTVEGIDELRSISSAGNSVVIVTFNLNRDIDIAAQDVRDRVQTVLRRLPDNVDPPTVSKFNNDSQPIMSIALSGNRTLRELTELADKTVKVQLERSVGVGEIDIRGNLERAINIWVDADKLAAHQLPITAVRDAIARQNIDVPGGNVTGSLREQTLRTMGRLVDPASFDDLIIANVNGTPLRIRDIGRAEDGTLEQRSFARLDGTPAVVLEVRRQSGANTVQVIEGIKAAMDRVAQQLPSDVKMEVIRDQSNYIYAALHEINVHLVLGSLLACLVVLAFMRSWRSTIIAGIAIPTSVISTFAVMWALDFTLNSVTMLALVLMVGIVIDDAIVVLENIYRFVEEKRMTALDAAREATREIGLAVLATTLSLVVIFIPVSFMSSISGRFLYQFGITAAVAVMVSLLVSFTLTPMMSARLLKGDAERARRNGGNHHAKSRGGFYSIIDSTDTFLLKGSIHPVGRWVVTLVAIAVIASSVPLYRMVRQEYVPSDVDEAEFSVDLSGPEGIALEPMDDAVRRVEEEIRQVRGVRQLLTTVGGGFIGSVGSGNIYVRIAPHEERTLSVTRLWRALREGNIKKAFEDNYTQADVMQEIRQKIGRKYRVLRPQVRSYPSFNIGGGPSDVNFVIRGPDLDKLSQYTEELRDRSDELGITDANTTLRMDKPEIRVVPDRQRAADLGVDSTDIGQALRLMVGGEQEVSRFRDPNLNEDYDVQLRLSESDRRNPNDIPRLFLPRKGGGVVEVANVTRLEEATGPSRVDRQDRQRSAAIRAGVAKGYALADRIEALRDAVRDMNLPPAYSTVVTGRGRELERTFTEFLWAFLLSVIFMYMILASNYESLVHPLTILLSLPLTIPFALLSLYLTGGTLNLYSALGLLVLFGVVKKNSILQIDHMNTLRAAGMSRYAAIIQGNRDRLRPILMTTLALVAGMLPLAVGSGPGAEERRAVAIVVIGGQTLSLLLTLLVTPVAYMLFDDIGALLRRRKDHDHHREPDIKSEPPRQRDDEVLAPAAVARNVSPNVAHP